MKLVRRTIEALLLPVSHRGTLSYGWLERMLREGEGGRCREGEAKEGEKGKGREEGRGWVLQERRRREGGIREGDSRGGKTRVTIDLNAFSSPSDPE